MPRNPKTTSPRRPSRDHATNPSAGRSESADLRRLATDAAQDEDPGRALTAIVALRREIDLLEIKHVDAALREGWSWSRIGAALGVSKQAVHRKHAGRRLERAPTEAPRTEHELTESRLTITGEARGAIEFARVEALAIRAPGVLPEHLLLGLLSDSRGVAARAFVRAGVDLDALRTAVADAVGAWTPSDDAPGPPTAPDQLPVLPPARAVFEQSLHEALADDSNRLGVEHILLALLRADSETITAALRRLGKSEGEVREALARERPDSGGAGEP